VLGIGRPGPGVADASSALTWFDILAKIAPIGPILSGFGVILGATIAGLTAFYFTRRQTEDAWVDRFRALYGEFWKEEPIIEVREWIVNERSYKSLEEILIRRNSTDLCEVSHQDHVVLDKIDRFCSMLARIKSFDNTRIPIKHRPLLVKLLDGAFWVKKIKERDQLLIYVEKHWPELFQ
jgi:hypothetical protein